MGRMRRIYLVRQGGWWTAIFREDVAVGNDLVDRIPTAWRDTVAWERVAARIGRLNPGWDVQVLGE